MNDEFRQKTADALDEQEGEATPSTGQPVDSRHMRRGNVEQDQQEAKDEQDSGKGDSKQAIQEQDRQLESGEENPT